MPLPYQFRRIVNRIVSDVSEPVEKVIPPTTTPSNTSNVQVTGPTGKLRTLHFDHGFYIGYTDG